jgi:uncharacterized protein
MTRRASPRPRVKTIDAAPTASPVSISDSMQNLQARLGSNAGSMADATQYVLANPITRNPRQLEFMYRQSWIVGAVVDSIADDMTRAGVDYGSAILPAVDQEMHGAEEELQLWEGVGDTIRWGRLYGGAIGVMLIDGQDMSTPLNPETVGRGMFKGILALSRWELIPSGVGLSDPANAVQALGPHLGKQEFYVVGPNAPALMGQKIHYTRVIRQEGVKLPFYQRMAEQGWSLSVIERMFDRLVAFDSATQGAAQLVYKAYLRTIKVKGLRQILAAGGKVQQGLERQLEAIRRFQSTEGLSVVDAEDDLETQTYTFAGLDDVLTQFGQQISGAVEIPLIRLFGQSPGGLNATGEGDLRNYYDGINAKQNRTLKPSMTLVLDVLHRSVTGEPPPADFNYTFKPLWQLSETEKAEIAVNVTNAVGTALQDGVIDKPTAMQELKQSSDVTGIFTNITDTAIKVANSMPPSIDDMGADKGVADIPALLGQLPISDPAKIDAGLAEAALLPARALNDKNDNNVYPLQPPKVALSDAWNEALHPRGQPANAGEFASEPGGGRKTSAAPGVKKKT